MPFVVEGRGLRLKRTSVAAVSVFVMLAAACGDSSSSRNPVGPDGGIDAAALAGDWSGTIAIFDVTGTLRLQLVGPQRDGGYTGTWSAAFAESSLNRQGTLSVDVTLVRFPGTPVLPMLAVNLAPTSPPSCDPILGERPYRLQLGVVERNRMSGNGEFGGCGDRINLARVQLAR